ncbi:MAG: sulfocyanin-like copper-binding protein [Actinomycetota bacterium]|nr:hypothetical protein [Actinomycetota bacterium]
MTILRMPPTSNRSKLTRPLVIAAAFVLILMAGCSSSAPTTGSAKSISRNNALGIALSDFAINGAKPTVSGGTYSVSISNAGKVQHELLVFKSDLTPDQYPLKDGDVAEDGQGVSLISDGDNINPGEHQSRVVNLKAPGKYLFVCNLPGHFKAGMHAEFTVTN